MTVSDNTIAAGNLGDVFKSLGKKGAFVSEKMAKNVSKIPGRDLEIGSKVGSEFTSQSP